MSRPLSVLMSVYNGEQYLPLALDSLLNQSFDDFELIVADDQSTDRTGDILSDYAAQDSRIRIIQGTREGLGVVRNLLVKEASAPMLAWLDADDVAHPTRLEKQLEFMSQHPEIVGAGTSVRVIDEDGDVIKDDVRPTDHETIDRQLIEYEHNAIFFPSSIVRAMALERVGGFRTQFPVGCDTDLWLRLAEIGRLGNLAEMLLDYRWHAGGNSWKVPLWQRERAMLAINDARRRRGLEAIRLEGPPATRKETPQAKIHDTWAAVALFEGHHETAKKHAWRSLRHNPFTARPWETLALAHFPLEEDASRNPILRPVVSVIRRGCLLVRRLLSKDRAAAHE